MPGVEIEVKYFNTFVLKKTLSSSNQPIWNGSFGIPAANDGGYPVVASTATDNNWAIEESRIRGGFNNTSVDFSPRAYLVEDEPNSSMLFSSLIYSGIFNSRTGVNDTNVFPVGSDITKSADPANGSIQKLYAEDTNLIVLQEYKVSRALIDKDAIYSAEGGGSVTSSNLVIGVLQPYAGNYGISQNPESFAVYGYRKYFADKNNNVVLRLSRDGMTEISGYGMKDFFRDQLNSIDTNGGPGVVRGAYDLYTDQYVISMQQNPVYNTNTTFKTLTFDDTINGWPSLYTYQPDQIFSIRNNFYSFKNEKLYRHNSEAVNRNSFYGSEEPSSVTVIFNPNPTRSKTFSTMSYEGSNGWELKTLTSDPTGKDFNTSFSNSNDTSNSILSYVMGEYVINPANGQAVSGTPTGAGIGQGYVATFGTTNPPYPRLHAGFDRKENAYVANLVNSSAATQGEIIFGEVISGIKGFYATATFSTDKYTDEGGEKQLFSVATDFFSNNGY
jgi:hypothetical protein